MFAPVVLFCYNRPLLTRQTLLALSENTLAMQSELFVFCDGPKPELSLEEQNKIQEVRRIVKENKWCKKVTVFESAENKGLANSVINGVTKIINEFGKVIVLEDDLLTSVYFLEYMNAALDKYDNCKNVFQISAHIFPVQHSKKDHASFFLPMTTSWGWATWKRAWDCFDPNAIGYERMKTDDGMRTRFNLQGSYPYSNMLYAQLETKTVDSWAIRWWWSVFLKNGITLFPDQPLVKNIGFGDEATHTEKNPFEESVFDQQYSIAEFPEEAKEDQNQFLKVSAYLSRKTNVPAKNEKNIFNKILNKIFK
jgi:hypothetical protein